MDNLIIDFLEGQKLASICCIDEHGHPQCFTCFYAFDKKRKLLYFKTSVSTLHFGLLKNNPVVAGTIQADQFNPLALKGIQFTGKAFNGSDEPHKGGGGFYHRKYPFALAVPGEMWTVHLDFIKLTDNSLGFGKKITWKAESPMMKMENVALETTGI